MRRIYLDHNATTPLDPAVADAMAAWIRSGPPSNPSSLHREGRAARRVVEDARESLADVLGTRPDRIVFLSGATEANALALHGLRPQDGPCPGTVAVSRVEHPSVLAAAEDLARRGRRSLLLDVTPEGRLAPDSLDAALAAGAGLVSVMAANNEVGTLQPVAEVAERCRARGALFHCDGVQWLGKLGTRVADLGADAVSLSAHKIGGPSGVGALWLADHVRVDPRLTGGGQERERRAGTENVAGILGFGVAMARLSATTPWRDRLQDLEERFLGRLRVAFPRVVRHGPPDASRRLPGTLNLRFPGVSGEALLFGLDLAGIAVSLGAACSSGAARPSHVLAAMGLSKTANLESLRISFGRDQTGEEADRAARIFAEVLSQQLSR